MNRKHATLSLATAMLLLSSGTVFAQDDRQQARGQRGGLAGAVPGGNQGRAVEAPLPLESLPLPEVLPEATILPAELPTQASPTRSQAPTVAPALPPLDDSSMPSLPALGEPGQSDDFAPIVDQQPSQTDQSVTISQEPAEKKPGFFKRMWTKVKGFVSGVSTKVKTMIANNRAKRAERKAAKALETQSSQHAPVLDYQSGGGGDGASGSAAE